MKYIKIFSKILLFFLAGSILSGCWNYRDIEKLSIVSGFSIDKNSSGDKYIVTVELIDFELSGKDARQTAKYVEAEGNTVFDAVRNVINYAGKKLYWAHASVAIISQDIAKEGITPAVDLIMRDAEMREEMYICISEENNASDILKQELPLSQTSSDNIENILTNQNRVGGTNSVKCYQLIGMLESESMEAALPCFKLEKSKERVSAEPCGLAVFRSDKLVGFLSEEEAKYYLFAVNKIENSLLTLKENPKSKTDDITLEIYDAKTSLKPELILGKPVMNISIKLQAAIGELGTTVDYIQHKDKVKKAAEDKLKDGVESVLKRVQSHFGSDIFGYGAYVEGYLPNVWNKAKKERINLFEELAFNVKVDILIKNSSFLSKNIRAR